MQLKEQKPNGYLTVYMTLILLVMLPLCLLLVESSRQKVAQLESHIVADVGMSSILAEYHRELFQRYQLFFVDTSYGTEQPSYLLTQDHLRQYIEDNLTVDKKILPDYFYLDPLALRVKDVSIDEISLATDYEGKVFQKEVLNAARSSIGLDMAQFLLDQFGSAGNAQLFGKDMDRQIDEAVARLHTVDGKKVKIGEKEWIEVQVSDPVSRVWNYRGKGILNFVVIEPEGISEKAVNLEQFISVREKQGQINEGNGPEPKNLSLIDRMLLLMYYLEHTGSYIEPNEESFLSYEKEYLLCGKNNDLENLADTATQLCLLRGASNCMYLASDERKMKEIEAAATACSAIIFSPEAEPLFEAVIFLGWAYMESVYDVKQLLLGNQIPLFKSQENWHYSLGNLLSWNHRDENQNGQGLDYNQYLGMLLLLQREKTITFRFMDLIEMNIRNTPGNQAFRMDGCAHLMGAKIQLTSDYGYEYSIDRVSEYQEY